MSLLPVCKTGDVRHVSAWTACDRCHTAACGGEVLSDGGERRRRSAKGLPGALRCVSPPCRHRAHAAGGVGSPQEEARSAALGNAQHPERCCIKCGDVRGPTPPYARQGRGAPLPRRPGAKSRSGPHAAPSAWGSTPGMARAIPRRMEVRRGVCLECMSMPFRTYILSCCAPPPRTHHPFRLSRELLGLTVLPAASGVPATPDAWRLRVAGHRPSS
jgi:hypothetical protein